MKILFITKKLYNTPLGGREQLSINLQFCLSSIFKDNFFKYELERSKKNYLYYFFSLFGNIDGVNKFSINQIINHIKNNNINKIFIDGSNLGLISQKIKNEKLKVEVYTFFHNVESHFFKELFETNKTIKKFMTWFVIHYIEKKSIKFSDKIICLSDRDNNLLHRLYNRSANFIFPMIMQDKLFNKHEKKNLSSNNEKYILFVGGNFYGNIHGIKWFIKNVLPEIDIKLILVGFGLEKYRPALEVNNKVKIVDSADSLNELYKGAVCVIAPIFKGSGMKTKVAESLMFGKIILATKEASSGYDLVPRDILIECFDKNMFIDFINKSSLNENITFNKKSRGIYEKFYSLDAGINRFKKIFSKYR